MYNYKIKFTRKQNTVDLRDEDAPDKIEWYWNALSNNGQVIGGYDIFSKNNEIFLNVVIPEIDSLCGTYDNDYVKKHNQELAEIYNINFIYEGENLEFGKSCSCVKPSWLYLYTEIFEDMSPLICGDCALPVPLYKVPFAKDEKEHCTLLGWQQSYQNMYKLWIYSLWDRFTIGQIMKHDSKLNATGRDFCKDYEVVLNAPVYYHIHYGIGSWIGPRKPPKVCPQCSGEWLKDIKFFRCEKCRIITHNPDCHKDENEIE